MPPDESRSPPDAVRRAAIEAVLGPRAPRQDAREGLVEMGRPGTGPRRGKLVGRLPNTPVSMRV
jgi:hypothetical protein